MTETTPCSERALDALWIGVLCLVTAAVWFVGVRPVTAARDRSTAERAAFAAAHDRLLTLGADVAACRAQLKAAAAERARRGLTLEPALRLNHRLATLNELSGQCDVRLDDVQPSKPTPGTRYDLLPIRVAGSGNYAGLVAFLHRLQTACPDVGVGGLCVTGVPSSTSVPATFTVDLTWYARGTTPSKPAPNAEAK